MGWAPRRPAPGGERRVMAATAVWFAGYLVVVGPLVRWWAGDSLTWWSLASVALASPFFVVAHRAGRRS